MQHQNFTASTTTNRYIIGPTAELRLPFGLGVEVDILYRHFSYGSSGGISGITSTFTTSDTTGGAWEFPDSRQVSLQGKTRPPVREMPAWRGTS